MAFILTGLKDFLFGTEKPFLATVAIDLGATYSGFAFLINKEQDDDSIFMNRDWVNELGHRTSKTPTCLLLKPDLSFDSFGYKAVERYAYLRSVYEAQDEFLFFQLFNMNGKNDKKKNNSEDNDVSVEFMEEGEKEEDSEDDDVTSSDDEKEGQSTENGSIKSDDDEHDEWNESEKIVDLKSTLKASNGRTVRAITVLAHCIKFLRDEAIMIIREETGDDNYNVKDIQWVLTVPVMWAARSKQFMREAAYKAGIGSRGNPRQVMIVSEAEAALHFCVKTEIRKDISSRTGAVMPDENTPFIIADIGGGSLNVTAYEQHEDGTIDEIYKATCESYDTACITSQLEDVLNELFGAQLLDDYRQMFPSDWLKIMQDFEVKKRAFQNEETKIRLPGSFVSSVNDFYSPPIKRYGAGEVKILDDEYLCLIPKVMLSLFQPFIEEVKHNLRALLQKQQLSKATTMFIVGGYADCFLLQEEIKKEFSDEYCVIAPPNAISVVFKGALMVAQTTAATKERVIKTTYGVDCSRNFVSGKHPEEKMFVANGKSKCRDLFNCFVKESDTVKHGQKVSIRYRPREADETEIKYTFYAAATPDVMFVTDPGVTEIGSVVVHSPDTRQGLDRDILVSMSFGGTEIIATAWDVTSGNRAQTTLDVPYSRFQV
ncbi:hypothetical protein ACROYT_G033487 [Oculina patagonica]